MSSKQNSKQFIGVVLETIGGPLLWGLIATFSYYFAVQNGFIKHPLLVRYTAGHPVEYVELGLFFVGLFAIMRRGRLAVGQLLRGDSLPLEVPTEGTLDEKLAGITSQFEAFPARLHQSTLVRTLRSAIEHVRRNRTTEHLEDELKYLSDLEAERTHDGYSLARIIIWATPMLGFLGTVIGITLALGDLSPEALVNSPKDAMEGLLSGLSVAFDTTALALTLSITLMFSQFLSQQVETQLLSLVDRASTEILSPLLRGPKPARDPQVAVVREMAEAVVSSFDENSRRQNEMWQTTLEQSHRQWTNLIESAGITVQESMASAVESSLAKHWDNLASLESAASESAQENWTQWHSQATEMLRQLRTQQAEMTRHGEVLNRVLDAAADVTHLEKALNENLRALAGAKNFEDTVMSLSAAIHLLSSRLTKPLPKQQQVKLEGESKERAA